MEEAAAASDAGVAVKTQFKPISRSENGFNK